MLFDQFPFDQLVAKPFFGPLKFVLGFRFCKRLFPSGLHPFLQEFGRQVEVGRLDEFFRDVVEQLLVRLLLELPFGILFNLLPELLFGMYLVRPEEAIKQFLVQFGRLPLVDFLDGEGYLYIQSVGLFLGYPKAAGKQVILLEKPFGFQGDCISRLFAFQG